METPSGPERELIATVRAHLKRLVAIASHNADEADLRAATGALRLLVADGALARAWHALGLGGR